MTAIEATRQEENVRSDRSLDPALGHSALGHTALGHTLVEHSVVERTSVAHRIPMDGRLSRSVTTFSRTSGTSEFSVLHSALAIVLSRLGVGSDRGGHTDVTIGTAFDHRAGDVDNRAAAIRAVPAVAERRTTMLVLRSQFLAATTVDDLVAATFRAGRDALDPPHDPTSATVVTPIDRYLPQSRHPSFTFSIRQPTPTAGRTPASTPTSTAATVQATRQLTRPAEFTLRVHLASRAPGSSDAWIEVSSDAGRLSENTARHVVQRLLRVVRAMLCDPQRSVGDIRVMDPLEVASVSPVTGPVAPPPMPLGHLLTDAARRNPTGLAAVTDTPSRSITYRELNARADLLARLLLEAGVGGGHTETVVVNAMSRSIESVVATWAILKAGAVCVPVDPADPSTHIGHVLAGSGADLVVCDRSSEDALHHLIPGLGVPVVVVDDATTADLIAHSSHAPVHVTERPVGADRGPTVRTDQLAYIAFRRDVTPPTDAVMVTHAGLAAFAGEIGRRMSLRADSRVLHLGSAGPAAPIVDVLLAAAGTSTLVIAPADVSGGRALAELVARHHVTHVCATPTELVGIDPHAVPTLTCLAVGGEVPTVELVRRWAPGRTMFGVHGSPESTITTSTDRLDGDSEPTAWVLNSGVGAVILDARLHPTPPGVTGDLYLIGDQLARGYHQRRDLTAARFVAAPPCLGRRYRGRRMYRTGHLASLTPDRRIRRVSPESSSRQCSFASDPATAADDV